MLRFLFVKIVLCVSTFIEIGFLVLRGKVQTLYFVYIACTGERLLLLVVECRERLDRNNRSDLAIEVWVLIKELHQCFLLAWVEAVKVAPEDPSSPTGTCLVSALSWVNICFLVGAAPLASGVPAPAGCAAATVLRAS